MSDEQNPRAFPSIAIDDKCGGMQLRDWFAGQALASVLTNAKNVGDIPDEDRKVAWAGIAMLVYELADAMLVERARCD